MTDNSEEEMDIEIESGRVESVLSVLPTVLASVAEYTSAIDLIEEAQKPEQNQFLSLQEPVSSDHPRSDQNSTEQSDSGTQQIESQLDKEEVDSCPIIENTPLYVSRKKYVSEGHNFHERNSIRRSENCFPDNRMINSFVPVRSRYKSKTPKNEIVDSSPCPSMRYEQAYMDAIYVESLLGSLESLVCLVTEIKSASVENNNSLKNLLCSMEKDATTEEKLLMINDYERAYATNGICKRALKVSSEQPYQNQTTKNSKTRHEVNSLQLENDALTKKLEVAYKQIVRETELRRCLQVQLEELNQTVRTLQRNAGMTINYMEIPLWNRFLNTITFGWFSQPIRDIEEPHESDNERGS